MPKMIAKMPKADAANRDRKRDKDGWKANVRKARKAKDMRRDYESGEGK